MSESPPETPPPETSADDNQPVTLAYEAQTLDGLALSGTIEGADADDARRRLELLGLRVLETRVAAPGRERPARVRGADLLMFNEQLAQLTRAGLPIEHGLRMMARDVRHRGLSRTIGQVADQLDAGRTLTEAFAAHRGSFPPFYGQILEVGVKTNNLAGVLFAFGRHFEMIRRLRASVWQAATYPLLVFVGVLFLLLFVSQFVLPSFELAYADFDFAYSSGPPGLTSLLFAVGPYVPWAVAAGLVLLVVSMIFWRVVSNTEFGGHIVDQCVLPLPLLGGVIKHNLVAQWCDTMKLAVTAGMDLPGSITMAGRAVASPLFQTDSDALVQLIESGHGLESVSTPTLPATVIGTIALAGDQNTLADNLEALAQMYQRQSETRLSMLQTVLTPILLAGLAFVIAVVVIAMFHPFVRMIQTMM